MPTLKKRSLKTTPKAPRSIKTTIDEEAKLRQSIYNSPTWHNLRDDRLMNHPFDEVALVAGVYVPADIVHHKDEWLNYRGGAMYSAAFSSDNLIALHHTTHNVYHAIMQNSGNPVNGQGPEEIYKILVDYCKRHDVPLPWQR